jgi:hypothetical protein
MTHVMQSSSDRFYIKAMFATLFRIAAFLALAFMPLGMSTGHAAAAGYAMAEPAEHCGGASQPGHEAPLHQQDCVVGCVAVPPAPMSLRGPETLGSLRRAVGMAPGLRGIILEIVPPPPKIA